MAEMYLYPSEINYSQDSISCYFSDGTLIGETLDDLCDHRSVVFLVNGFLRGFNERYIMEGKLGYTHFVEGAQRISINSIPMIEVYWSRERVWIGGDNRRLWVFKQLQRLGKCRTIPVEEIRSLPRWKRYGCHGFSEVKIRGGSPGGRWHHKRFKNRH